MLCTDNIYKYALPAPFSATALLTSYTFKMTNNSTPFPLLEFPNEILAEIVKHCPREGIEVLSASNGRLQNHCKAQLRKHRDTSSATFLSRRIVAGPSELISDGDSEHGGSGNEDSEDGSSENEDSQEMDITGLEAFVQTMVGHPDITINIQRLSITQGEGHYCKDSGYESGSRVAFGEQYANPLYVANALEELYREYDTAQVDALNPALHDAFDGSAHNALVRLALTNLWRVRQFEITTTERGDGGFLLGLMKEIVASSKRFAPSPIGAVFDHLVVFTLISQSQIEKTRRYNSNGIGYLQNWGKPCSGAEDELRLVHQVMKLPNIKVLRCYGLCQTNAPKIEVASLPKSRVQKIILKRCKLWVSQLKVLIDATQHLTTFTYDHTQPDHIWRLKYRSFEKDREYYLPDILRHVVDILYDTAIESLETLDLSCEMFSTHRPKWRFSRTFQDHSLKDFHKLRVCCLRANLWPTADDERAEMRMDMADFLPPSIEKVHIIGEIKSKHAQRIFNKQFNNERKLLPRLVHVSSDHTINMDLKTDLQKTRASEIHFEVIDRNSADKHISPRNGDALEAIWSYPDVKPIATPKNLRSSGHQTDET